MKDFFLGPHSTVYTSIATVHIRSPLFSLPMATTIKPAEDIDAHCLLADKKREIVSRAVLPSAVAFAVANAGKGMGPPIGSGLCVRQHVKQWGSACGGTFGSACGITLGSGAVCAVVRWPVHGGYLEQWGSACGGTLCSGVV